MIKFPEHIDWYYNPKLLPEHFIKFDLFGLYRINGIVALYIEDDGRFSYKCQFDEQWTPDLLALLRRYLDEYPQHKLRRTTIDSAL